MAFFQEHLPTILVGLVVLAIIVIAVWRIRVNKKRASHCGGGCSHCGGGCPYQEDANHMQP